MGIGTILGIIGFVILCLGIIIIKKLKKRRAKKEIEEWKIWFKKKHEKKVEPNELIEESPSS